MWLTWASGRLESGSWGLVPRMHTDRGQGCLESMAPPELRRFATQRDMAMCGLVVLWTRAGW